MSGQHRVPHGFSSCELRCEACESSDDSERYASDVLDGSTLCQYIFSRNSLNTLTLLCCVVSTRILLATKSGTPVDYYRRKVRETLGQCSHPKRTNKSSLGLHYEYTVPVSLDDVPCRVLATSIATTTSYVTYTSNRTILYIRIVYSLHLQQNRSLLVDGHQWKVQI